MFKPFCRVVLVSILSMTLLSSHVTAYGQTANNAPILGGVSEENKISSIVMLAVGFIATRLYDAEKITTDMMLAAAGGAVFIYGELSSTDKFKNLEKDLKIEIKKNAEGKADAAQIDHIKGLKKSYVDANDVLQTKKTMQIVAATAFAAAALVAYTMSKEKQVNEVGTVAVLESVPAAAPDTKEIPVPPPGTGMIAVLAPPPPPQNGCPTNESPVCLACNDDITGLLLKPLVADIALLGATNESSFLQSQKFEKREQMWSPRIEKAKLKMKRRKVVGSSPPVTNIAGLTALSKFLKKKYDTDMAIKKMMGIMKPKTVIVDNSPLLRKLYGHPVLISHEVPLRKSNFFEDLFDFAIPKAEAGSMAMMLGMGGAAAGLLLNKISKDLGDTVDRFLLMPRNRAIVWGILGGLSLWASMSTQHEIDKIDENIKKIDGILNVTVQIEKPHFFENIFNLFVSKVNADTNKALPVVPSKSLLSHSKMPCLVGAGDTNCPSMTKALNSIEDFGDITPSLQVEIGRITQLADELSGSTFLSPSTMASAQKIASRHEAMNELVKQAQNDLDKINQEAGIPRNDFAGEQKNLLDAFKLITLNGLHQNAMTADTFLASYGGKPLIGTDASSNPAASAQKKTGSIATTTVATSVATEQNQPTIAVVTDEKTEQKVYKVNDITTNKDESIWSVISNRYFKSAFPKFFDQ